ncbi:MAG: TOBE domain-containing protein [Acidimicrobiales bacterium]
MCCSSTIFRWLTTSASAQRARGAHAERLEMWLGRGSKHLRFKHLSASFPVRFGEGPASSAGPSVGDDTALVAAQRAAGCGRHRVAGELRRGIAQHLGAFDGPRLLITHDPADAFLLADRIVIIESGTLSQQGTPDDIRRRPMTSYAAAVAGTNLLQGTNRNGLLELVGRNQTLQTSVTKPDGPVLITIHPTSISLHRQQPSGSPRNTWLSVVDSIEPLGDTTRITLGEPLPVGVDITPGAALALDLQAGSPVWASVKATEVEVNPG